jgi:glycosyltransferase involved in cell wall biosynthesis
MSLSTLYLCYFGLREPLVQTQVLPYLRQIGKSGIRILILTFEPNPEENWTTEQIEAERKNLADEGIEWHFLKYHKRPSAPATLYDVLCGAWFAWKTIRREKIDVLHARVHIPAMMGLIAKKLSFGKVKLFFDIRGFFPDEYVDAGFWKKNGWLYKSVKIAEKWLLKESDAFVVLTEKAREILFPESKETGFDKIGRPVEVIPCCVEVKRFEIVTEDLSREMRRKLDLENRFVIVYVGSFGGFYMTKETADFYGAAREKYPNAFALILTQTPREMIQPLLEKHGYTEKDFFIKKVSPHEIPLYLSAGDAALSFIKPSYSKIASSPTKNAEYLACGLPMIANSKVGDTTEMTLEDGVGVIIDDFNRESYKKALEELDELLKNKADLTEKCKNSARKRFDLQTVGGKRYLNIYRKLLNI